MFQETLLFLSYYDDVLARWDWGRRARRNGIKTLKISRESTVSERNCAAMIRKVDITLESYSKIIDIYIHIF